jgi:hypothetical protein
MARRNVRRRAATNAVAGLLVLGFLVAGTVLMWRSINAPDDVVIAAFGPADPLDPPMGGSFVVDGFSGTELDSRWEVIDPGSAVVALTDGSLVIDVPAGTEHEAWGRIDRPRVALEVENEGFIIDVTFSRLPSVDGQSVGVSFEQNDGNWIALDIASGPGLSVQALSTEGEQTTVVGASAVSGSPELITLRVSRDADTWNVWFRPDNREFVEVAAFVRDIDISSFAIGAGGRFDSDGMVPGVVATVLGVSNVGSGATLSGPTVEVEVVGEGSYSFDPALEQLSFGDELIVRAQPATGWELLGWSGPGTTEGSARRVVVDGDLALGLAFGEVSTDTVIDVWYGLDQTFGIYGKSQNWVNVLGNVSDPDGFDRLSYSLNGGPEQELGIGPDKWRLGDAGDFNVEIAFDDLELGENLVELTAVDAVGNIETESVTVRLVAGDSSLRPIQIDWADVDNIQDVVQVTDGHFEIRGDTLGVVSADRDRLFLIGDESWTDYEVRTVITPRALDTTFFNPQPGPSNFFLAGGWLGHVDWQGLQPQIGYWPTGAFALVLWPPLERIQLTGNEETDEIIGPPTRIRFGVSYNVRFRVETLDEGVDYRFKLWPEGTDEPVGWDLELLETTGPRSGSIGLAAHHLDAVFGSITVTPL